jgi:hypothetical protein
MKLKFIALLLLMCCFAALFSACEPIREVVYISLPEQASCEYKNETGETLLTCTLTAIEVRQYTSNEHDYVTAVMQVENTGTVAISKVSFDAAFINENGEVINEADFDCNYDETPLLAGDTTERRVSQWIYEGVNIGNFSYSVTGLTEYNQDTEVLEEADEEAPTSWREAIVSTTK